MQWGGGYYNGGITPYLLKARRYYNASTCRFMSRDPIGYGGGINQYAFAGNDPVNNADPSGLSSNAGFLAGLSGSIFGGGVGMMVGGGEGGTGGLIGGPDGAAAGAVGGVVGVVSGYSLGVAGANTGDIVSNIEGNMSFGGGDDSVPSGGGCPDAPGEDESGVPGDFTATNDPDGGVTFTKEQVSPRELQRTNELDSGNYLRKLQNDISANGMRNPIKYAMKAGDDTKYIVDGNHRVVAAMRLGMDTVPAQQVNLPYGGFQTEDDLTGFYGH